jgi:hypothetical protein
MSVVDALEFIRRVRPSSCQWSDNYKFNPFTTNDVKHRSFTQERFLEMWVEQRGDTRDRSLDTPVSSTMSARHLAEAEKRIAKKQAIFASNPQAIWDSNTHYNCYICENILSIGPYPAGSSAWKPLPPKIVPEEAGTGGNGELVLSRDARALADTPPYHPTGDY